MLWTRRIGFGLLIIISLSLLKCGGDGGGGTGVQAVDVLPSEEAFNLN